MGDIVGRLFREFAVTLAVTILVSAVVSLTLTPMMCSKLLKHTPEARQGWFYRKSEHAFNWVIAVYGRTLRFVLRFQTITLLVAIATLALTVLQFYYIPKGFFPIQDTGVIQGVSEAAQTVSFSAMSRLQQSLTSVILKDPAVDSLSSFIGIDGTNTTLNSGRMLINLKPLDQRDASASDVIRRLQPELEQVAGITLFMQPVQDITVDDRVSRTQFQYTLEDPSADELNVYAPRMLEGMKKLPDLSDVASDQQVQGLRARLVFDRDTAARAGHHAFHHRPDPVRRLRPARSVHHVHAVEPVPRGAGSGPGNSRATRSICASCSSAPARAIRPDRRGWSREALPAPPSPAGPPTSALNASASTAALASSTAGSSAVFGAPIASSTVFPTGGQVPLSAFSRVELISVPITVNHQGQFPVVTFSFNLAPDASLGDAVNGVNRVKDELGLPASIQAAFQGTAQAFQASLANEWVLILAALVTVYIVLGVLYESYIHPVTILSTLPSAGVGALLALNICHERLQRDRADRHRAADRDREEERHHDDRFRAGRGTQGGDGARRSHLPGLSAAFPAHHDDHHGGAAGRRCRWRFGTGTGSELRRPLGITIIGGLIFSQMLTLYTTPVIYLLFDRLARRFSHKSEHRLEAGQEPVAAR